MFECATNPERPLLLPSLASPSQITPQLAFNSTNLPVVNDKQIVAIRREDRWQYGGKFDGNTCRKFDNNNCRKFDGNNYMNFDDNCHNKRRNYHPNLWRNKGSKMTRIIA
eukprot:257691_1